MQGRFFLRSDKGSICNTPFQPLPHLDGESTNGTEAANPSVNQLSLFPVSLFPSHVGDVYLYNLYNIQCKVSFT